MGRVFCGNQYIGATSVNGVGKLIPKYVEPINLGLIGSIGCEIGGELVGHYLIEITAE